MRVGIYLSMPDEESGGAYTLHNLVLEGLENYKLSIEDQIVLLCPSIPKNRNKFQNLEIIKVANSKFTRIRIFVELAKAGIKYLFLRIPVDIEYIKGANISRQLKRANIDILWSVAPLGFPLEVPFVSTVWDIQHRILPIFPEVSFENRAWMKRERTNKRVLGQASLIVTGTLRGASEISKAYGVEADRIIISPFPVAKPSHKSHLKRDPMLFFYPAQFWPHKNHITLLHAFAAAKNQTNLDLRLVLCGSDKGNEAHVQRYVRNLNLEANVEIKGFVSNEELRELYLSAGMMLFPSFFGPDNLPPLEAMSYGCPVAVADVPGAREQLGDAARFFAPNSVSELAKVISSAATQPEKNLEKVSKGSLLASERNPERYVATVLDRIFELETIIWNFPR